MKTILCFGDSNIRGEIPGSLDEKTGLPQRYAKNKRWTGILQNILGSDYEVIEEGLSARTTNLDEIVPGRPHKNGLAQLPVCLEAHYPITLVVLMLGTNDTKIQFNRSAAEIAASMRQLIQLIKVSNKGINAKAPKILVLAPSPIIKIDNMHPQLDDSSIEKSKYLGALYQQLAKKEQCDFLDASLIVRSSQVDGVHLDEIDCERLGRAVAEKIKQLFSD